MRYLLTLLGTTLALTVAYAALGLALSPSFIAAEYWIREAIVIKRHIAEQHRGQKKILIASGSNALFGIDAEQLSSQFYLPVINFGLHAGLQLQAILKEVQAAAEPGDIVILPLEEHYYCVQPLDDWQVRNIIAWDRVQWSQWSAMKQLNALTQLGLTGIWELAVARYQEKFSPAIINSRRAALDDAEILARFHARRAPTTFDYSAYNLDGWGDMQKIDGASFTGTGPRADATVAICPDSRRLLGVFKAALSAKNVKLYFANQPYIALPGLDKGKIERRSMQFVAAMSDIAPVLDTTAEVVFDRSLFFNTALHLNAEGRRIRTERLSAAIKRNIALDAYIRAPTQRAIITSWSANPLQLRHIHLWLSNCGVSRRPRLGRNKPIRLSRGVRNCAELPGCSKSAPD